jgi:PilZ domain
LDSETYSAWPGSLSESEGDDSSVNYLRRLRGNPSGGARTEAGPNVIWRERRQSPRLRCSGSVEFRAAGNEARLWGTLTDISLHGCYVEMNSTFPVQTKADLILKSCGIRIQVPGTVRTSYPSLGMGICFDEIEPKQAVELKRLLAALAERSGLSSPASAGEKNAKVSPLAVDSMTILSEITEFFQKKPQLSREEFQQIVRRARRP